MTKEGCSYSEGLCLTPGLGIERFASLKNSSQFPLRSSLLNIGQWDPGDKTSWTFQEPLEGTKHESVNYGPQAQPAGRLSLVCQLRLSYSWKWLKTNFLKKNSIGRHVRVI